MATVIERTWKTIDGAKVTDVLHELQTILGAENVVGEKKQVHIGTDSQQDAQFTQYVTVIAILNPGHGGRAFYSVETVPRIRNLRERLLKEVWTSVSLALELNGVLTDQDHLTVHVDANPNTDFKSSAYVKELTSLVLGQGFKAVLKPNSWLASHIADQVVKNKVIGYKGRKHRQKERA